MTETLNFDCIIHYSPHPEDPVLFYGGWASNFVGGPFRIACVQPWSDGKPYERGYFRVEHFFAASKATTRSKHNKIANLADPWEAKAAGRRTQLRSDWEGWNRFFQYPVKYEVMLTGLRVKFAQPEFREKLLATDDRLIAEDSPTDFVWGIRDAQGGWTGDNLLGRALMLVREELRR